MLRIRIGMTKDEVRDVAGEPLTQADMRTMMLENTRKALGKGDDDDSDMESLMQEMAEAEGIELPEPDGFEFPPGFDVWSYKDVPEVGNMTSVSFKDDRVFIVSYALDDEQSTAE